MSASATLREVFPGLARSGDEVAAQARAAEKGIKGDHSGHAVPHRFMGDQGDINLFPQNGVATAAGKNFNNYGDALLNQPSLRANCIKSATLVIANEVQQSSECNAASDCRVTTFFEMTQLVQAASMSWV